jgi:hypothetical protein
MTDFKAKHRELYLEELKCCLQDHTSGKNTGMEKLTLNIIFSLINRFDLSDMGEVLLILKLLKSNLSQEDFRTICIYEFNDYSTNSLHKITYKIFKDNLIDIILESGYAK